MSKNAWQRGAVLLVVFLMLSYVGLLIWRVHNKRYERTAKGLVLRILRQNPAVPVGDYVYEGRHYDVTFKRAPYNPERLARYHEALKMAKERRLTLTPYLVDAAVTFKTVDPSEASGLVWIHLLCRDGDFKEAEMAVISSDGQEVSRVSWPLPPDMRHEGTFAGEGWFTIRLVGDNTAGYKKADIIVPAYYQPGMTFAITVHDKKGHKSNIVTVHASPYPWPDLSASK